MPDPARPTVDRELHRTGIFVIDVPAAVAFYRDKLGFDLAFTWGDPPTIAGVTLGEAQIFLERSTPNPEGCNLFFLVGDADELFEFQRTQGVEVIGTPGDREYGIRDYSVRDLHGYQLSFGHYIYTMGDRVPIERVDVPVRLERRLAALLRDLAEHKRSSLASCLEEMILHTNDGVGPHTKAQLRHIEELKRKHGIDYDSHASYRFVEGS